MIAEGSALIARRLPGVAVVAVAVAALGVRTGRRRSVVAMVVVVVGHSGEGERVQTNCPNLYYPSIRSDEFVPGDYIVSNLKPHAKKHSQFKDDNGEEGEEGRKRTSTKSYQVHSSP